MPVSSTSRNIKVKSILFTLPKPETEKSPYFDLAKKYNLKLDFRSFIHVEGVPAKDFRKDKINLADFTAVIFTSRNAADHYFRICEEMRFEVPAEMKYFCLSENIALYLQKYIQYRKRKIFFGKQSAADLADLLKKHTAENFLYPCSDVAGEETQNFFTSAINEELNKLKEEASPIAQNLINDALKQIKILENDYTKLKVDLTNSGDDNRVIYAMISNFQNRIDILKNTLNQIEIVKQLKNSSHDTSTTI